MDPHVTSLVGATAFLLAIAAALSRLGLSSVAGYLVAGVALGPHGLGLIHDLETVARVGDMGVVLLLFFVGVEIPLREFVARLRLSLSTTALQILAGVACCVALGLVVGWPVGRSVLLGFVISLSSTSVVIKLLRSSGELHTPIGRDVLGVLLTQDLAVAPMLVVLGLLGGRLPSLGLFALQLLVAGGAVALLAYAARRPGLRLPLGDGLRGDRELQVFVAFLLCFGFAVVTDVVGLSAPLGAFVGGLVVGSSRDTGWVQEALRPFQVLFLAAFFVSIGMLLDLRFLEHHCGTVLGLTAGVLALEALLDALVFVAMGRSWRSALYGGVLLSQLGEFGFVLTAVGHESGLLEGHGYQLVLAVVTASLLASPFCIAVAGWLLGEWGREEDGLPDGTPPPTGA